VTASLGLRDKDFGERGGIFAFPAYDGKLMTPIARQWEEINILPQRLKRGKEHELEHIKLI